MIDVNLKDAEFKTMRERGYSFMKTCKTLFPDEIKNKTIPRATNYPWKVGTLNWLRFLHEQFNRPIGIKELYFNGPKKR